MQGARIVGHEMRECVDNQGIDILCMQEPYTKGDRIGGMSLSANVLTGAPIMRETMAAVSVHNSDVVITKISQYSDSHCVTAEVQWGTIKFFLVNVYFQYSDEIGTHLDKLDRIINNLSGVQVIVTGDFNARSTLWFDNQTNNRGVEVEDFISRNGLFIMNQEGTVSTYSHNGESNIDLTLASAGISRLITDWSVMVEWTSSDHRTIVFTINESVGASLPLNIPEASRYALKNADWDVFKFNLDSMWSDRAILSREDIDGYVESFTNILTQACEVSFTKIKYRKKVVSWWTPALTESRRRVARLRKRYQRTRNDETRRHRFREFKDANKRYCHDLEAAKQKSFEELVTSCGNKEPFGLIYKMQTNKMKPRECLSTLLYNGCHTESREETSKLLLDTLLPDDDIGSDTPEQAQTRLKMNVLPDTMDAPSFAPAEIEEALMSLKKRKAPGNDNIEVQVLQHAWDVVSLGIIKIMNACLSHSLFPRAWKSGNVVIIRKDGDKDPKDPKSYRPIMLLPVMGKLLEKLITKRIMNLFDSSGTYSNKQYGFRSGKSTEDALKKLIASVQQCSDKYALGVFLDISGAFDNLWWPSIFRELSRLGLAKNLYGLTLDYFKDRTAVLKDKYNVVVKELSKGSPQGSIMGPYIWNIVFNDSMQEDLDEIAYADDKVFIIYGNSRQELQDKAQLAIDHMNGWCKANKMQLSTSKTIMLQLKGKYNANRPPVVKVNGQALKMVKTARYLGVDVDERLGITTHVKRISDNTKKVFHRLARLSNEEWGLKARTLATIYRAVVETTITYACAAWYPRANCHHIRQLVGAQRNILLWITKAYRTVSADAVSVIAGIIPIDLLLQERVAKYCIYKRESINYGNLSLSDGEIQNGQVIKKLRDETLRQWQDRWHLSDKGRYTFEYFPNIPERLQMEVPYCGTMTQFLSGHGKFRSYLTRFAIQDGDICVCGLGTETADHVIYDCRELDDLRSRLIADISYTEDAWPVEKKRLVSKDNIKAFKLFCKNAASICRNRNMLESRPV